MISSSNPEQNPTKSGEQEETSITNQPQKENTWDWGDSPSEPKPSSEKKPSPAESKQETEERKGKETTNKDFLLPGSFSQKTEEKTEEKKELSPPFSPLNQIKKPKPEIELGPPPPPPSVYLRETKKQTEEKNIDLGPPPPPLSQVGLGKNSDFQQKSTLTTPPLASNNQEGESKALTSSVEDIGPPPPPPPIHLTTKPNSNATEEGNDLGPPPPLPLPPNPQKEQVQATEEKKQEQNLSLGAPGYSYKSSSEASPKKLDLDILTKVEQKEEQVTIKLSEEEVKRALMQQKIDPRTTERIDAKEIQELYQRVQKEREMQTKEDEDSVLKTIEGINKDFKINQFYISKLPIMKGSDFLIFDAFKDEERNEKCGIIKLAKKGHEKQLTKEIEFAQKCINKEIEHANILQYQKAGITSTGLSFAVAEKLNHFPRAMLFEDSVACMSKIAGALSYLHKNRLYHRDIKPENILFAFAENKIRPKLVGFKTVSKQIESQNLACSPYFAAPEILKRILGESPEIQYSKSDTFSLGMTFLGMLRFNPFLKIEPNLEKNIDGVADLIDRISTILEQKHSEFLRVIEEFLNKNTWNIYLKTQYGIIYERRKEFTSHFIPILHEVLSLKPEERPLCANLAKKLESQFWEVFSLHPENYFLNGCKFIAGRGKSSFS